MRRADVVFVENRWMYERLKPEYGGNKIIFAPPGVDTPTIGPVIPWTRSGATAVGAPVAEALEICMKRILILSDYYLPGYKSGGVMRTIVNLIDRLGDSYDFSVMTRGFDVGEKNVYPGIAINDWNKIGGAQVFHVGHGQVNFSAIRRVLRDASPDAVYLASCFSTLSIKFLTLRRLGMAGQMPVILAPEGEFSSGALQLKATKKKIFRGVAFPGKLYRDLVWKAASEPEKADIQRVAGADCEIYVAPNMPPRVILDDYRFEQKPRKEKGAISLIFLSRVMPKKNLLHTLEILPRLQGEIELDVYGPLEDELYWRECKEVIARLPERITVTQCGPVPYERAAETMAKYHFFVLPTLGENFGHVMTEAFSAGCPVLISDQTPWRNLEEKQIGWDLPLDRADLWLAALQKCVSMDSVEYEKLSSAARKYATDWLAAPEIVQANAYVLDRALSKTKEFAPSAA